jgi:hypothetical protein
MADKQFVHGPTRLRITPYAGPELPVSDPAIPYADQRRRYQLTTDAGMVLTLSRAEWHALADWFQNGEGWADE